MLREGFVSATRIATLLVVALRFLCFFFRMKSRSWTMREEDRSTPPLASFPLSLSLLLYAFAAELVERKTRRIDICDTPHPVRDSCVAYRGVSRSTFSALRIFFFGGWVCSTPDASVTPPVPETRH